MSENLENRARQVVARVQYISYLSPPNSNPYFKFIGRLSLLSRHRLKFCLLIFLLLIKLQEKIFHMKIVQLNFKILFVFTKPRLSVYIVTELPCMLGFEHQHLIS